PAGAAARGGPDGGARGDEPTEVEFADRAGRDRDRCGRRVLRVSSIDGRLPRAVVDVDCGGVGVRGGFGVRGVPRVGIAVVFVVVFVVIGGAFGGGGVTVRVGVGGARGVGFRFDARVGVVFGVGTTAREREAARRSASTGRAPDDVSDAGDVARGARP